MFSKYFPKTHPTMDGWSRRGRQAPPPRYVTATPPKGEGRHFPFTKGRLVGNLSSQNLGNFRVGARAGGASKAWNPLNPLVKASFLEVSCPFWASRKAWNPLQPLVKIMISWGVRIRYSAQKLYATFEGRAHRQWGGSDNTHCRPRNNGK